MDEHELHERVDGVLQTIHEQLEELDARLAELRALENTALSISSRIGVEDVEEELYFLEKDSGLDPLDLDLREFYPELSARVINALSDRGYKRVRQVLAADYQVIRHVRNIGPASLIELRDVLRSKGYKIPVSWSMLPDNE
jgi:DNA-directed RNA polymerase alpha subunit